MGIGRFDRPDPRTPTDLQFEKPDQFVEFLKNPQAWNRYAYVNNNPLGYTDPTGESAAAVAAAGGFALADGPLPIGDLIALGILTYAATEAGIDLYNSYSKNKDYFKKATGLLEAAMADLMDPGHSGMDPEDPDWLQVVKRFWDKITKALALRDKINNQALKDEINRRIAELLSKWQKEFGPHGPCLDNQCSGLDPRKQKNKGPASSQPRLVRN